MWLRLACGADGDVARRVGHDHQCCGRGLGSAHPGVSGYASSEAGLMRLTDTLAAELVRRGSSIRVPALMPGLMCSAVTEGVASLSAGRERSSAITDGLTAGQDGDAAISALTPLERHNLAFEPEGSGTLSELLSRLRAWMDHTDDPLLAGMVPSPSYERALSALAGGPVSSHMARGGGNAGRYEPTRAGAERAEGPAGV